MKKVSIIISVYNVEQFLDECVRSVLAQTYNDFEIILVNDGSTDYSAIKCEDWRKKDSRIRVIHKKNGGVSSARNVGIEAACGEYIYFLDGDDFIDKEMLNTVIPFMDEGYDMVSFQFRRVDELSKTFLDSSCYEVGSYELIQHNRRVEFLIRFLQCKVGWEVWNRIYRRSIIEQNGLKFLDTKKIFAEDLYFSTLYLFYATKVICLEEIMYNYRKRTNSIMQTVGKKANIGKMNELSKNLYFYINKNEELEFLKEAFPVFHLLIIRNAVNKFIHNKYSPKQIRELILLEVDDWEYFIGQCQKLFYCDKYLKIIYSSKEIKQIINFSRYTINGFYLGFRIKKKIIDWFGEKL